jgi:hypothetical protein
VRVAAWTLSLAAGLALGGCSSGISQSDLDDLVLAPEDVPPGLVLDERASGTIKELGDAFRVKGGLDPDVVKGFVAGRENTYVSPGSPQPGQVGFVGSLALLFADERDAREFMAFSKEFQVEEAPVADELPADGLGEAGYGVHYPPDREGNESYGYVWRVGTVVLTVAVGGPAGSTDAGGTLSLAEIVDDRVP